MIELENFEQAVREMQAELVIIGRSSPYPRLEAMVRGEPSPDGPPTWYCFIGDQKRHIRYTDEVGEGPTLLDAMHTYAEMLRGKILSLLHGKDDHRIYRFSEEFRA